MKNQKAYLYVLAWAIFATASCKSPLDVSPQADLIIHNALISTLNEELPEAEAIAIRGNHILAVGNSKEILALTGPHTKVIDVRGKRIIPGLIDSHAHFLRQGNMPGHLIQAAENVKSVSEMVHLLRTESKGIETDKFITVMGGFVLNQLAEKRLPTLEELTTALPERPVFIQVGFDGPCVVNQKGKEKLEAIGLTIAENGFFAKGRESILAFRALQIFRKGEDKFTNLKKMMQYANSLGLTGVQDEGGTNFPNSSSFDTFSDYDALQQLRQGGEITLRLSIQHVIYDKDSTDDLLDQKLNNTWQGFGDDMVKYWTVGEHIVTFPMNGKVNPFYVDQVLKAAQKGWTHEQHSVNIDENQQHLAAIKQVNEQYDVQNLRWSLAHVFELGHPGTDELIQDLRSLKMGLKVQNHGYYTATDKFPLGRSLGAIQSGPLFRTLLALDIPMGAGTDGPLLGPLNPWFSLYYMVTGKDVNGNLVNAQETLNRLDALRLYTLGSAWHSFDDDILGSLEKGKLADLVVLDQDYFSVSEEAIKSIESRLTIVNGKIVHNEL